MGKKRKRNQRNASSIPSLMPTASNFSNAQQKMNQFPSPPLLNGRQLPVTYSSEDLNSHNFNRPEGPFVNEVSLSSPIFPDSFPPSNDRPFKGTFQGNYASNLGERLNSTNSFNSGFSPQMNNQSEQMEIMRAEIMELKTKLKSMEDAKNRVQNRNFMSMEDAQNRVQNRNFMSMEDAQNRVQNRNFMPMENSPNGVQNNNLSMEDARNRNFIFMEDPQNSPQNRSFKPTGPTSLAELLKDVPYVSPYGQNSKAEKQLKAYNPIPRWDIKKTNVSNKLAASIKLSTNTTIKHASKSVPLKVSNKPASSNSMATKATNKPVSNTLPLTGVNKSRIGTKKPRKGANKPALLSNAVPTGAFTNYASKFNKQNNRPNLAKPVKCVWKSHLNSAPLPLTQFSNELGIINTSSGQPNNNWIRRNINDDGLLPTPRLLGQGNNLGQNLFHQVNPSLSTLALTGETYQRPLSEHSHFSAVQNAEDQLSHSLFRNKSGNYDWLDGKSLSECDADLSLQLLQLKQQKVEDQLSELDKRSQEMEQNLSLLQNEYFLEF